MKELVKIIVNELKSKNKTLSFMESCTGGYLVNEITNISGASEILKVSLVTYSSEYKIKFGVNKNKIEKNSVYSKTVSSEMAENAAKFSGSDYGIGITRTIGGKS